MTSTKRFTAVMAALLLVAAPVLAQQSGSDGDQQDQYANNSSSSDGADHNETDRDPDGSQARDGNQSEAGEDRGPYENASDVGKDAREFARDAPENAKRNVSLVVDGAKALVDMSSEDNPGKDKIGLDYAADRGSMNLSFDRDADDGERPDFELNVQLASIVEYEDLNDDGDYDPGEDEVLATTGVDGLEWSVEAEEVALDANTTGQQIRAAAPIGENGSGALEVHVTAPGDFATLGETELTPRDLKVDYVVDDYPYASNTSKVALAVDVGGEDGYEVAQSSIGDTPAVQIAKDDVTGYFAWKETAQVDGEQRPVNATLPAEADENATEAVQKVYMSYDRGEEIVHDPVMGVSYETASEEVSEAPGFGVAALVAAVSMAAVARAVGRRD